jgi:hypothetical protein
MVSAALATGPILKLRAKAFSTMAPRWALMGNPFSFRPDLMAMWARAPNNFIQVSEVQ